MQPQDQLTEVYERALPRLQAALEDCPEASELSGPHLLHLSAPLDWSAVDPGIHSAYNVELLPANLFTAPGIDFRQI